MSPKQVLHRIYVCLVVITLLAAVSGCGTETPTAVPGGGQGAVLTPTPLPTDTPAPTNTPVPSPTPTEIPIILPTPTSVVGPPPVGTGGLLPPTIPPLPSATPSPTITPTATVPPVIITPTATIPPTPLPPVGLNIVANYQVPLFGYSIPGYYPAPELTTRCIDQTYLRQGLATPTPPAVVGVTPSAPPPTPTPVNLYSVAADDYWYNLFRDRYITGSSPPSIPNPTAGPANASTPFSGGLPPSNPGFFATPTPNPPKPYQINGELKIGSLIITDTLGSQADITYYKPELFVMWDVMNNLTRQLVDPTVDPKSYQQTYEAALNDLVNLVLRINKTSRVIIGNVPDLTNMRYFQTCFNQAQLKQIQGDYNAMFNALARKYPGRVYIARLDLLDLRNHPQWVFLGDGLRFTQLGATEVAAAFGREFQKIRYR